MNLLVTEHTTRTTRHTTFHLACGREDAPPIILVHGWPELSISWRHQLPCFASLGFRAIAPDMRGYGRSSVYPKHEDYALANTVHDMLELLDSLGHEKAIWVGHDWGSPVVWSLASHHPDRYHGVANLCVPYIKDGFAPKNIIPLVDRKIYPEVEFPAGQWEYLLFCEENFDKARAGFEANIANTVKALFRAGSPDGKGLPAITAFVRKDQGWFGRLPAAPDLPMDRTVLTDEDFHRYTSSLDRNGFFGPGSWYMNAERNIAFARGEGRWPNFVAGALPARGLRLYLRDRRHAAYRTDARELQRSDGSDGRLRSLDGAGEADGGQRRPRALARGQASTAVAEIVPFPARAGPGRSGRADAAGGARQLNNRHREDRCFSP